MGDMDSGDMMTHTRDTMDDETFVQTLEHMANHESMPMASGMDADGMIRQMMDHMMVGRGGDRHGNATPTPR